jgi:hypothetical protein
MLKAEDQYEDPFIMGGEAENSNLEANLKGLG